MTQAEFLKKLLLTTALVAFAILLLEFIPGMAAFRLFAWVCCLLFVLLSVLIFIVARPAATDPNKNKFTNVVIGAVMGKLALSMAIILAYFYGLQPESRLFIAPFFIVYLGFTIFELHFLMRLGKMKPH